MKQRHHRKVRQRIMSRPVRSRAWRARANAWGRAYFLRTQAEPRDEIPHPTTMLFNEEENPQ